MQDFFNVISLSDVLAMRDRFQPVETERVNLSDGAGRILAQEVTADRDIPGFHRSTMDGYAVRAASTFGASDGSPAWLSVAADIRMGEAAAVSIGPGEAAKIATGGMMPEGADAVVMIEHAEPVGEDTIEVYKSVAPGQHVVAADEDFRAGEQVLIPGTRLRPQEVGLLAAFGITVAEVYRKPMVGIISTGDEVIDIARTPEPGQIRDVNAYSIGAMVQEAGGEITRYGIVADQFDALRDCCRKAAAECDMVLISGGSSVGNRDYTLLALEALPDSELLVHGIAISPGKPAILSRSGRVPVWGLPGHITSAMIVFETVVRPFLHKLAGAGAADDVRHRVPAILSRNLSSAQGRTDFVRVRLRHADGTQWADPVLGKSGLLNTMIQADGLVEIDMNAEGLDAGETVMDLPL